MSLFAILLTSLFFFGFAVAEISAPSCLATWGWTFNSLGQDPCAVAAYMLSTCNGGSFVINPLQPGYSYSGPSGADDTDLCECNTIAYSLISACDACQGATWISWAQYKFNCTKTLPPSTFPNPVPAETSVPFWALFDVTAEGTWNPTEAHVLGDTPEAVPGTSLAPPARCMCFRALHCACGRLILSIQLTKLRFPETEESTLSGRA